MGSGAGKHVRMAGPPATLAKGTRTFGQAAQVPRALLESPGNFTGPKKTKPAGQGPAGSEPETGNVCDGSTSQHEPGPAAGSCL